ncbi:MAG TPA: hydantoinase/carbamoylase family amidase, partial [Nitrososphaerales archaeon]|nr:hydantoinase/carbamoylase family amidase [Nitrososphaerales archaeon]
MTGSKYIAGLIDEETASALTDREGVKFEDAVKPIRAFRPLPMPPIRKARAFVELHIEQGPTLEAEKTKIGVVGAIVGIRQFDVRIEGSADHAGTTPMGMRKDSLVAASELVLMVREAARKAGTVGTVGFIENAPNAPNVVPGAVELTIDVRHGSKKVLGGLESELRRRALIVSKRSGCSIRLSPRLSLNPTKMDGTVKKAIGASVEELGLSHREIDSGAGHDTMNMANICPVGMIFVPSVGGKSHSPAERSRDSDLVNGANVLAATLARLAL